MCSKWSRSSGLAFHSMLYLSLPDLIAFPGMPDAGLMCRMLRDLQSPILNLRSAPLLAQHISPASGEHLLLGIIIFNPEPPTGSGQWASVSVKTVEKRKSWKDAGGASQKTG
ncbi:uncharacterized protein AAGF69_001010 isoform 1-T1 [Amazona ochrocephala]